MIRSVICLILAALLLLAGCTQTQPQAEPEPVQPQPQAEQAAPAPVEEKSALRYLVDTEEYEDERKADDGTVLATVKYEYPVLRVVKEDGSAPDAVPQEMAAKCETFNARFAVDEEYIDGLAELAQADLDSYREAGSSFFAPCSEESSVASVYRTSGMISVDRIGSSYWGGAHPNAYEDAATFDLETGEFIEWTDLTDDADAMREILGEQVVETLYAGGYAEWLFDDWETTARALDGAVTAFDATGLVVTFSEYTVGPHAAGLVSATVEYSRFADLLNERGERLLELPETVGLMGDYFEAARMWSWFSMTTMPLDQDAAPTADGYLPVKYRGVTTMAALRELLETRFAPELVDSMLDPGEAHYKEIDGVLCALQADRGADITRGKATYEVELDGSSGQIVATVEELDWDAFTDSMTAPPVKGYATVTFPFVVTENGAQFTAFDSIW